MANRIYVLLALLLPAIPTSATPVTFAQFTQASSGNTFAFTRGTSQSTFNSLSTPVNFVYLDVPGILDPELTGIQSALLTLSATTTTPVSGTTFLTQPIDSGSITIRRISPATIGNNDRTNLLTINFVGLSLFGPTNGRTLGGISNSVSGDQITFTSDFLDFENTITRDFSLSFTSVTPILHTEGSFLHSFSAAGTGTFDSDPPSLYSEVPEPTTLGMFGLGILLLSVYAKRRASYSPSQKQIDKRWMPVLAEYMDERSASQLHEMWRCGNLGMTGCSASVIEHAGGATPCDQELTGVAVGCLKLTTSLGISPTETCPV
jgi:hypothetical protein